jgi:hypothetical protein
MAADSDEPAPTDDGSGNAALLPSLHVQLPPGWIERSEPDEAPLWLAPSEDQGAAALHVSRLADRYFGFISAREELGAFTASTGEYRGMGAPERHWEEECALGRCGAALFNTGYRAWICVAADTAYLWTWIDQTGDEVALEQARGIVSTATEAEPPAVPELEELVAALESISQAAAAVQQGTSPEQIHMAVFFEVQGEDRIVSGKERPSLSGRFQAVAPSERAPAAQHHVCWLGRFDEAGDRLYEVHIGVFGAEGDEVCVRVARDPDEEGSQRARLRVASLWAQVGQYIHEPYAGAAASRHTSRTRARAVGCSSR